MVKRKFKKNRNQKLEIVPKDENPPLEPVRVSDEPITKKENWTNRQRVLIFAARGINHRDRHLMRDIRSFMPHHRPESKMERSKTLTIVNNMCEMKNCNKAVLFEGRRKKDLYMWVANVPKGPSAKFLVENIHTMGELKLTGNCLCGSRPLLSFDTNFDKIPYLSLLRELFVQVFGVPRYHPKSQPFFDHVFTFAFLDNRIWFRNFQILSEDGGLAEVGPRFVMNPVKIFDSSFTGKVLWSNPDYVSPTKQRQMLKKLPSDRYVNRTHQKATYEANRPKHAYESNVLDEIFNNDPIETAKLLADKQKEELDKLKKKKIKAHLNEKIKEKQMKKVKDIIEKKRKNIKTVNVQ